MWDSGHPWRGVLAEPWIRVNAGQTALCGTKLWMVYAFIKHPYILLTMCTLRLYVAALVESRLGKLLVDSVI